MPDRRNGSRSRLGKVLPPSTDRWPPTSVGGGPIVVDCRKLSSRRHDTLDDVVFVFALPLTVTVAPPATAHTTTIDAVRVPPVL
jgi:hypothetical protein